MRKKILIGLGILIGLVLLFVGIAEYYLSADEEKILDFIKNNPAKTAILLVRNDTSDNKTELAYFMNNLSLLETLRLQRSMSKFEKQILTNSEFRSRIKSELP